MSTLVEHYFLQNFFLSGKLPSRDIGRLEYFYVRIFPSMNFVRLESFRWEWVFAEIFQFGKPLETRLSRQEYFLTGYFKAGKYEC